MTVRGKRQDAEKELSRLVNAAHDGTLVEPNKVTALIGPSGCGKSTFIRCLNRMNDYVENCRVTGKVDLEDDTLKLLATVDKPTTLQAAREQLMRLRGRAHTLFSGVCVASGSGVAWRHCESADLAMRDFSDEFLDAYCRAEGETMLISFFAVLFTGRWPEGMRNFVLGVGRFWTRTMAYLLMLRDGVTVLNAPGTVDADFRGEIVVLLINHGSRPVTVARGMRIAQLVVAANNTALPPSWTPRRFARYLRWAWLVEGGAQYFSRQVGLYRAATIRRLALSVAPRNDPAATEKFLRIMLEQAQRMSAPRAVALCQCFNGALEFQAGNWKGAEASLRESIALYSEIGAASGEAWTSSRRARWARRRCSPAARRCSALWPRASPARGAPWRSSRAS